MLLCSSNPGFPGQIAGRACGRAFGEQQPIPDVISGIVEIFDCVSQRQPHVAIEMATDLMRCSTLRSFLADSEFVHDVSHMTVLLQSATVYHKEALLLFIGRLEATVKAEFVRCKHGPISTIYRNVIVPLLGNVLTNIRILSALCMSLSGSFIRSDDSESYLKSLRALS